MKLPWVLGHVGVWTALMSIAIGVNLASDTLGERITAIGLFVGVALIISAVIEGARRDQL